MKTGLSALVMCLLAVLVTVYIFGAESDANNDAKDQITGLLKEFAEACSTHDIKKMESLFLPSDNTPDGENRMNHIEEMRKDWSSAKDSNQQTSVEFTHTVILIRTLMEFDSGTNKGTLGTIPVEFKLSFDKDGYKIVSMEYLTN